MDNFHIREYILFKAVNALNVTDTETKNTLPLPAQEPFHAMLVNIMQASSIR